MRVFIVTLGICLWSTSVFATPVTWYLDAVFTDGATAIGSFVYDAEMDRYGVYTEAAIDVMEVDGSVFHYVGDGHASSIREFWFGGVNDRSLFFQVSPLAFQAETSGIDPLFSVEQFPDLLPDGRSFRRMSGTLTTATPVPEPSTLAIVMLGAWLRCRRHQLERSGCG